jgi:hypothetical protein
VAGTAKLTERDRAVLEHVRRHRITTARVVKELFCGGSENASKKLLQRLKDYLVSEPLYGKAVYYRMSPAAAKLVAAPPEIADPLGPQALPEALGILMFCCRGKTRRWRYNNSEFGEDFPELKDDLAGRRYHLNYYLDL